MTLYVVGCQRIKTVERFRGLVSRQASRRPWQEKKEKEMTSELRARARAVKGSLFLALFITFSHSPSFPAPFGHEIITNK